MGPTPEPLEYVPSPGRPRRPSGYPPSSTGPRSDTAHRRSQPPPPPYNTHPRMRSSLGRAQPRNVVEATGQVENLEMLAPRGEPLETFRSATLERPNPPTHAQEHRGGGAGTLLGAQTDSLRAQKKFGFWKPGGNPWQNFGRRGQEGLTPPRTPPGSGGAAGRRLLGATGPLRAQKKLQI